MQTPIDRMPSTKELELNRTFAAFGEVHEWQASSLFAHGDDDAIDIFASDYSVQITSQVNHGRIMRLLPRSCAMLGSVSTCDEESCGCRSAEPFGSVASRFSAS